jgi:hypothetical protein
MTRGILLLTLLVLLGCKTKVNNESKTITITSNELKEMVSFLASDDLLGRDTGSDGIDRSATYIEEQFKSYGVRPYYETYRDSFKVRDLDAFNVVGYLEGNDPDLKDEVIIIGAHYDHIGHGPDIVKRGARLVETDTIANGANDNATGTVGVMAIAKYLAAKNNNKRSFIFALFSAEEMGLLGSKHLAKRMKTDAVDLYSLVNFEMIGVPLIDKDYVAFLSGYGMSNMAGKINEYSNLKLLGESEIAKNYQLFKRSDNYPFYQEFELPSHTISSCDLENFDFYHQPGDESHKMDYEHMAGLINALNPAIEAMSNTPTREIQSYEK